MSAPLITLTTDFGTADGYAGAMKGVILSLCRKARIVDITHQIPAHDVWAGALALHTATPYFPPHTIHVAVVDPGVGTKRRAIGIRTENGVFIGPDNGLFTFVFRDVSAEVFHLSRREYYRSRVSRTFHGRDVFAPLAAHLARGISLEQMGDPIPDPVVLPVPDPEMEEGILRGCVIHVDRFGNLVTNITESHLERLGAADVRVSCGGRAVGALKGTYSDVPAGAPVALMGSGGFLEIARNGGRCDEWIPSPRGTEVTVAAVS